MKITLNKINLNTLKNKKTIMKIKKFDELLESNSYEDNSFEGKLEKLRKDHPDYDLKCEKHPKFKNSYIVSLYKDDNYIGALKGPVSPNQALEFFEMYFLKHES